MWLSENPAKRYYERQMLLYQPLWISVMALVVMTHAYEHFGPWEYLIFGIIVSLPTILIPLRFPCPEEIGKVWYDRFWVKSQVWIGIMTFIGNYLWTHYFYVVLKARYDLPQLHHLNGVPVCMYLITQAYFVGYFTVSNVLLRKLWFVLSDNHFDGTLKLALWNGAVWTLAYVTAVGETVTISSYPYYLFEDFHQMMTVGIVFYALDFVTSFVAYYRIDEPVYQKGGKYTLNTWSMQRVITESLANCMVVTMMLDFWKLFVGPLGSQTLENSGIPFIIDQVS